MNASRGLLPKGFSYDEGYEWLKAIGFGEQERKRSESHKQLQAAAKNLWFSDAETLERAQEFAKLSRSEQERLLADSANKRRSELPDNQPSNPERRANRVAQLAANAPMRQTESRTRSVSVGLDDVKQRSGEYLTEQYTIDSEMICQVCKSRLPFRLEDGNFYFERVEFLPDLKRHHYQNYLALCPNHSAMYQHANGSSDEIMETFAQLESNELDVILAQEHATIYFTKTHIADLRTVIRIDEHSSIEAPTSTTVA